MKFAAAHSIRRLVAGRERLVVVDGSLLNIWWGDEVGPQTADDLIEAHLRTIDEMIRMRIQDGSTDPQGDNAIVLTNVDWEG